MYMLDQTVAYPNIEVPLSADIHLFVNSVANAISQQVGFEAADTFRSGASVRRSKNDEILRYCLCYVRIK